MEKRVNASTAAEIISQYTGIPLHQLVDIMAEVPSEDVAPVRHGRWKQARYTEAPLYICSECDIQAYKQHNYCPNCGAKMDGDKNGS